MADIKVALIPAYEPGEILSELVTELKAKDFIVIVVDDGSGIKYEERFDSLSKKAVVLHHEKNRGKGAALKTGLSYIETCFGRRCTVVTVDADGQHDVADALRVCEIAACHPDELILGSRAFEGEVPLRSRMGNDITRAVYRLFTGVYVRDTQTGLRAFDGGLIPFLRSIDGDRYEYEMNMLLECARQGINMRETDIRTIYEGNNEVSHFNAFSDSFRIYKEIIRFSAASFLSFILDYFLYLLLLAAGTDLKLAGTLVLANVGARIVSGTFNYTLNRRAVFKSDAGIGQSALKYTLLAVTILVLDTVLLEFAVSVVGIHEYAAKVMVEMIMFAASYLVQKKVIFAGESTKRALA